MQIEYFILPRRSADASPFLCFGYHPIPDEPGNVMPCEAEANYVGRWHGDTLYVCAEHRKLYPQVVWRKGIPGQDWERS